MKPTREQVQEEIKKLKEMKPNVRHYASFGDDNHAAIEVQIRVLEQGLGSNAIYDRWDMEEYLIENALEAHYWTEQGGDPPSGPDGWGSLIDE